MPYTVLHPDLLLLTQDQCDEQMQGMVAELDAAASWPDHAQPAAHAESTMPVSADGNRENHSRGDGEVHKNSNGGVINNGGVISNASVDRGSAGSVAVQDGPMMLGALLSVPMCLQI